MLAWQDWVLEGPVMWVLVRRRGWCSEVLVVWATAAPGSMLVVGRGM
jgi:hypothetical protein